ncbi:hypothetical protein [Listeria innocua]|nr:hypothetical protein [Listeria innocua]HBM4460296.1 hypothetical protein [Listeria innocua]
MKFILISQPLPNNIIVIIGSVAKFYLTDLFSVEWKKLHVENNNVPF